MPNPNPEVVARTQGLLNAYNSNLPTQILSFMSRNIRVADHGTYSHYHGLPATHLLLMSCPSPWRPQHGLLHLL